VELARELKKNANERADLTQNILKATKRNADIKKLITKDFKIPNPTKSDVIRYRLWEELAQNGHKEIFTNKKINKEDIFSAKIEVEHIIPKALLFDDSFSNKTLAFSDINKQKSNRTALDFITADFNTDLENYKSRVESLFNNGLGSFSKAKRNKLLMAQKDLPEGFIERDLRNSQYIAKKAKEMLGTIVRDVVSTSGNITDKLREDWGVINVMKELNLPKYKALGLTEFEERIDKGTGKTKKVEVIKDWTKRNDHRHHAMDALAVAFTTHNHIQYLNFLSARKDENHKFYQKIVGIEKKIKKGKYFSQPMPNFRVEAKKHIQDILVSIKNKNKVVTQNINITKGSKELHRKVQLTPRGQLHKKTIYGSSKRLQEKPIKLSKRFTVAQAHLIANKKQRELVAAHLNQFNNDVTIAFDAKILKKYPILFKGEALKEVQCFEQIYTIRKAVGPDLKIDKVIDSKIQEVLRKRLAEFNDKPKEAFSNLDENPIWLNKEKGIAIKRVTIKGVNNVIPLHHKKNHLGKEILNEKGERFPVDFVSTGNNHHIAIYKDEKGNLQEHVVTFFEAVTRVNNNIPVVDKYYNSSKGWQFMFTMKQNEMFVFPSDGFNPLEIDLLDERNSALISANLFRAQKLSTKNYMFSHHLETQVMSNEDLKNKKELKDVVYSSIRSTEGLRGLVKVRINHIGNIVHVGEY